MEKVAAALAHVDNLFVCKKEGLLSVAKYET